MKFVVALSCCLFAVFATYSQAVARVMTLDDVHRIVDVSEPQISPDGTSIAVVVSRVNWDEDRLLAAVRAELRLALGITAPPAFVHVVRWQRAIPQYHLGHLDRVAWIEQRAALYPGLFLTGNAYHGVAMNDCTEQGADVALSVAHYLNQLA